MDFYKYNNEPVTEFNMEVSNLVKLNGLEYHQAKLLIWYD